MWIEMGAAATALPSNSFRRARIVTSTIHETGALVMTEDRVASPRRKAEDASCKNVDEALCEIDELLQRWDNRISIENLALAKRYLENKMEAGLVLEAISGTPPVGLDYIAVFKRKLSVDSRYNVGRARGKVFESGAGDVSGDLKSTMGKPDGNEKAVFVGDVDLVQTINGLVPSVVRLELADHFYRKCGRTIDSLDRSALKVGNVTTYWERNVIPTCATICPDELDGKMVKSAPQIVDTVAQDCGPFVRNGGHHAKLVSFVTSLRLYIGDDSVWPARFESPDGCVKVRKVFFGPVNLYADTA
jgi:hypothetical protein